MLQKAPLIKLRNLKELQSSQKLKAEHAELVTPLKGKKTRKPRTTAKKASTLATGLDPPVDDDVAPHAPPPPPSTAKRLPKSTRKEPPPNQLRIDIFFKTCQKNFKIEPVKEEPTPIFRKASTDIKVKGNTTATKKSPRVARPKIRRKRLFADETSSADGSTHSLCSEEKSVTKPHTNIECITLSDSDEEGGDKTEIIKTENVLDMGECKTEVLTQKPVASEQRKLPPKSHGSSKSKSKVTKSTSRKWSRTSPTLSKQQSSSITPMVFDSGTSKPGEVSSLSTPQTSDTSKSKATKRKPKPCPPYKIVEGTTFAVDAFQYGCIEGVTHYFLTHFHADHYIGLTRKFAMPLYMSSITARFVRSFIPVDEQYIHELELGTMVVVNNIEITALDANHCPGAVMLLFKNRATKKCTLHTGDFRAWHGMESEPAFWNNDIETIYLDTTYISQKYAFCTQYESIDRAKDLVAQFRKKHVDKRILYICGSYVIGKEKFWSALAEEFDLKVWTEDNRGKALQAMDDKELNTLLIDNPLKADMHVITMGKVYYLNLVEYFSMYQHRYDILLAIRPSGWEKDSRPQYRGNINIIGVEYSEHSSYEEMQRFVKFLKPNKVISTVPAGGRDLMKTADVPEKWYKYEKLQSSSNYQPRIEQFLGKTPTRKSLIRMPNSNRGGLEVFVSPLSKRHTTKVGQEINNNKEAEASAIASDSDFEQTVERPATTIKIENDKTSRPPEKKIQENLVSVARTQIKQEQIISSSPNLKHSNNIKQQNKQKPKQKVPQKHKMEPTTPTGPADNAAELVLSQDLKDGESCSIFIPNTSNKPLIQKAPSTNSTEQEYFQMALLKNRRSGRRYIGSSSSNEELTVSQKRNTRNNTEKRKCNNPCTVLMEEDEPEFEEEVLKAYLKESPTTSKMAKILAAKVNPLLRSTTNSCASSLNEEVAASQTNDANSCRLIGNKTAASNFNRLANDIIPASQTTADLESTPRPLRNKSKRLNERFKTLSQNDIIPASQTCTDWENTPRTLRNKLKVRNRVVKFYSQNDIIAASQTTMDLENTLRPLRNKRNTSSTPTSPPKKARESPSSLADDNDFSAEESTTSMTQNQQLTQILNESGPIDIYNTSQLVGIVAQTLADKQPDTSRDHIPRELLSSDPDAEDDWLH